MIYVNDDKILLHFKCNDRNKLIDLCTPCGFTWWVLMGKSEQRMFCVNMMTEVKFNRKVSKMTQKFILYNSYPNSVKTH